MTFKDLSSSKSMVINMSIAYIQKKQGGDLSSWTDIEIVPTCQKKKSWKQKWNYI